MASFETPYGFFSDDGKEYVITNPHTPAPWINVLSNGDYGFTLSQAGSGYSWRTHADLNRLTRWQQDLVRDDWGKYLYAKDRDTGEVWSLAYQPCKKCGEYRVRHGWGYSVIENSHDALRSEVTYFVPKGDPCELWWLKLTNESSEPKRLRLFSYFEWGLGAAPDSHREFHKLFIRTDYDEARATLLATKNLWELPGTHWNTPWSYVGFHSASRVPVAFESDKGRFLGRNGTLAHPYAVQHGNLSNTVGRFADAVGSLCVDLELLPGESEDLAFTLGAADTQAQALELAERYKDTNVVAQALEEVREYWYTLLGGLHIKTPDPAADLLANGWLAYQAVAGRLWGRSAYYQTGGAFGFRDQLQDSLVWPLLGKPEQTLEQIRLHAAHQLQEGRVLHWWHPLAGTGLTSDYSDDLLWLPFVVLAYLRETDDKACLEEVMPYYDEGAGTLLEHCLKAFTLALARRSARGLPLILAADWNDGLNAVGPEGRGESIWLAHFLFYLLREWGELDVLDEANITQFEKAAQEMQAATNQHGWDGAWYWRASTDEGEVLGSAACDEGKIFLNAQTWAVLSGLAPEERAETALRSARDHLYQEYGPLLLEPAYTEPDPNIGYLSRYAPGSRENGGVYVHAACWAVLAERQRHGADAAYELWQSFCPPRRGCDPERYTAEPYVMPGNVDGPRSDTPGRGGWTWYTGSAAWYLRALVEGVLGVSATVGGLRVDADLPEGWNEVRVQRRYRRASYHIHIRRALQGETPGWWVDGERATAPLLPTAPPDTVQNVTILLPSRS